MARDARLMRRKKKAGNPFLWFAGFLLLLAVGAGGSLWLYGHSAGPLAGGDVAVLIPPRSSLAAIEARLQASGVIRPDGRFRWYARLRGLATKLKAGEYVFRAGQTPEEVLRLLASGKGIRYKITIPEGYNIAQIADLVAASRLVPREQFIALAKDPQTARQLGVEADGLEGYLYPDTYYFTRNQTAAEIIRIMAERGIKELKALMATAPPNYGLTPHQVLTLASIVEKETGQPQERPLIASVFLNRLRLGMRLQADPTVIYGIANFNGNLTKADLRTATPYNTYVNAGLPPGPIASPGQAAITAVLHPAPESYLYFVSRNDGSHYFSTTLAEHNRAVDVYQPKRPSASVGAAH